MNNWKACMMAAVAAAGVVSGAKGAEVAVDQKDLKFVPDVVTLKAGDSIRFTDTDRIAHDVTIDSPGGASEDKGMAEYNQHIVVKFDKAGAYQAHCRIHPQMHMTIMVRP
ncbi:MAG: cupredoxin domain-containing protein [Alphaproteobacteria bacterium]|nr:cupredoxin domain-containing protein [Alphaproteobacteria bacterium]MBV9061403.1 cupredoxin domain-containing protein [Alphaproteobacteria bacterium]